MNKLPWLLAVLLTLAFKREAQAQSFQLVVNVANPTASISADEASKLFLKTATKWKHGAPAVVVDQPPDAAVRAAFSTRVHRRSAAAVFSYWQQQIFSGKEVPPAEKVCDYAVLAFVRSNPNAFGYVSADAALGAGVKRLVVQ
jgi:ABC-type phosphate transport system substrate-binding protein